MSSSHTPETAQLSDHMWSNRVVLVFASEHKAYSIQLESIVTSPVEYAQRDLVVYLIPKQTLTSPVVRMRPSAESGDWQRSEVNLAPTLSRSAFDLADDAFGVVLIGKDGGSKLVQQDKPLSNARLFETIDAMPMRQREMNSRK